MGKFGLGTNGEEMKIEYPAEIKHSLERAKQRQMELEAWLFFIDLLTKAIKNVKKDGNKFF